MGLQWPWPLTLSKFCSSSLSQSGRLWWRRNCIKWAKSWTVLWTAPGILPFHCRSVISPVLLTVRDKRKRCYRRLMIGFLCPFTQTSGGGRIAEDGGMFWVRILRRPHKLWGWCGAPSVSMRQAQKIPLALVQFYCLISDTAAPEIAAKLWRQVTELLASQHMAGWLRTNALITAEQRACVSLWLPHLVTLITESPPVCYH